MKTIQIHVSISPVGSHDNGRSVGVRIPLISPDSGNPRTKNELVEAAIERACHKIYGKQTFWWADNGLRGYGQVMRPNKNGGSDAVAYRARIDVSIPDLPAEHIADLEQFEQEMRDINDQSQRDYQVGVSAGHNGEPCPKCDDPRGDVERGWLHGNRDYRDSLTREF